MKARLKTANRPWCKATDTYLNLCRLSAPRRAFDSDRSLHAPEYMPQSSCPESFSLIIFLSCWSLHRTEKNDGH
jgi:hypothetical protein